MPMEEVSQIVINKTVLREVHVKQIVMLTAPVSDITITHLATMNGAILYHPLKRVHPHTHLVPIHWLQNLVTW